MSSKPDGRGSDVLQITALSTGSSALHVGELFKELDGHGINYAEILARIGKYWRIRTFSTCAALQCRLSGKSVQEIQYSIVFPYLSRFGKDTIVVNATSVFLAHCRRQAAA